MRRALLALAFLALAAVARAQVDEITDVIYEINNPPTAGATHALLSATHSDSVAATPVLGDLIYFNGTGWARLGIGSSGQVVTVTAGIPAWADATGGGSGAPTDATYITETADGTLSAEFAMGSLGTGLVKNTTTTGVPSIYAGTSCTNQFVRSLNASGAATCESIVNGDITAATIDLTTKVTGLLPYANLANGTAISVLGRSANSSGVNAPIQCTAASDAVLRESGSALGCGTVATAGIANSAITLAKIANAAASSRLLGSGSSGSGAAYTELTATSPLAVGASALSVAITAANDGGAIAKQASAPGTVQSTAFWNIDGLGTVTKDNIAATATDGFFASNTQAATVGTTAQYTPAIKFCGAAWNSSGAASETDCWRIYSKPITVAGTTTSTLNFDSSQNGGAFGNRMTLSSGGSLSNVSGNITSANNITSTAGNISASAGDFITATGNRYTWLARGGISSSADGQFRTELNAGTSSTSQFTSGQFKVLGGNSQTTVDGWVSELLTLATGATTTDTTIDLPADSIIEAVTYRITTTITTAVSFTIGDPTTPTRFCGTQSVMAATTTGVCLAHRAGNVTTVAAGATQAAVAKVRVTTNANPGAGIMRISVHYRTFTAPTS